MVGIGQKPANSAAAVLWRISGFVSAGLTPASHSVTLLTPLHPFLWKKIRPLNRHGPLINQMPQNRPQNALQNLRRAPNAAKTSHLTPDL
jgi:hypothetical protein